MDNRFDDFFQDEGYLRLKNHLYNYRIRREAVLRALGDGVERVLEVGSGVSPMAGADSYPVVYSDLSATALRALARQSGRQGIAAAADGCRLPFRAGSFSHTICSEVLEHVEDDRGALRELYSVLKPGGRLVITFPHRKCYYSRDDAFVGHHRRYEREEMESLLREAGFTVECVRKLLGPFEKLAMLAATWLFSKKEAKRTDRRARPIPPSLVSLFVGLNAIASAIAKIDARIAPERLATVLLVTACKTKKRGLD
jgi:ubiquinone/menaquinone biosynthesis C-methylase UbiE